MSQKKFTFQIVIIIVFTYLAIALTVSIGILHFGLDYVEKDNDGNFIDIRNWVSMSITLVFPIAIATLIWSYSHYKQQQVDTIIKKLEKTDDAETKLSILKTYGNLFILYESLRILIIIGNTLESSKAITNQITSILQMVDNDITMCAKSIDAKSIFLLTITLTNLHSILIRILGPKTTMGDLQTDRNDIRKLMPTIKDIFEKDFDPLVPEDAKFTIPAID